MLAVLFLANEQPIAYELKYLYRHIQLLLESLPDGRLRKIQTQRPAPSSHRPPPPHPLHSILDFPVGVNRLNSHLLLL